MGIKRDKKDLTLEQSSQTRAEDLDAEAWVSEAQKHQNQAPDLNDAEKMTAQEFADAEAAASDSMLSRNAGSQKSEEWLGEAEKELENAWKVLQEEKRAFENNRIGEIANLKRELEAQRREALQRQESELAEIWRLRMETIDKREKEEIKLSGERLAASREEQEREFSALRQEFEKSMATLREQASLEIDGMRQRAEAEINAGLAELAESRRNVEEERRALLEERKKCDLQSQQNHYLRSSFEERKNSLRDEACRLAEEQTRNMRGKLERQEEALAGLRKENADLYMRLNYFETLANKLNGREPEAVLYELSDARESLARLRQEMAERPPMELKRRYEELDRERQNMLASNNELKSRLAAMEADIEKNATLELELKKARQKASEYERLYMAQETLTQKLEAEISRINTQFGREEQLSKRIEAVKKPEKEKFPPFMAPPEGEEFVNEAQWLENIQKQCEKHEFNFPWRILHAFHTSLKISRWSPITVLAGVSGTGKSLLPRLYSLFGGINFLSVPVQPNWDSKESMLGFYNTIDNVYDAQPMLNFLAQSQELATPSYPGSRGMVNLILLDEMNLAHIELYFAEFLSKLEERRGVKRDDLPKLLVKIGAEDFFKIPLGYNLLFVGTMNQDETTKSLSDKVLDRSGVIHFPRPLKFERRDLRRDLFLDSQPEAMLPINSWANWFVDKHDFKDEEIKPFLGMVEAINNAIFGVGRSLGHRVWQSMESYLANYPSVRSLKLSEAAPEAVIHNMRIAFMDQLVQKVMTKLRGIETDSVAGKECLERIGELLQENGYSELLDDFNLARVMGYGQFVWNSANYLNNNPT